MNWAVAAMVLLLAVGGCTPVTIFQTGQHVGDDIVVSLDNPDFTEQNVILTSANTKWNGVMARSIDVTSQGFSVGNGDFQVYTWDGDGPAKSNGVSYFASVSDEELPARPDAEGYYASDQPPTIVDLQAQGLRIGFTAMRVQLFQIEPNHSRPTIFTTSRVRLDPKVALIPIEAVVVYHDKDAQGSLDLGMEFQRLPQQLAFWDHLPAVETTNITDGQYGELTSVIHAMSWYRRDKDGQYRVGTQAAPDTIWARCGVQFRLVNYFELQVPTRNVIPVRGNADQDSDRFWPDGTFDDQPLYANIDLAKRDPRHMEGTVLAIFMQRVGFPDAPEVGRAIEYRQAIGVSLNDNRSTDGVVAHELGHLSGLRDTSDTKNYNVMINPGPGIIPTDAECERIQKWADAFTKFWTEPHETNDH